MWKKQEEEMPAQETPIRPASPVDQLKERAVIGPSIKVKGEVSGSEDLLIHGEVEGKIELPNNNITVGTGGCLKADVFGKVISIEGEVQGNLFGEEKIIIRQSGTVRGNITAPRVNLEDGSKFKGSIDMDAGPDTKQKPLPTVSPEMPAAGPVRERPLTGPDLGMKRGAPAAKA